MVSLPYTLRVISPCPVKDCLQTGKVKLPCPGFEVRTVKGRARWTSKRPVVTGGLTTAFNQLAALTINRKPERQEWLFIGSSNVGNERLVLSKK